MPTKLAAGPGDEQEFENRFASLAYMQLRDRAPKLLEYVVGFQLVDRTPDKKKAVGVFGLKAGGTWMFAPSFFVGGDMKGDELLYVKDWDLFLPRTDEWVGHLIGRRPAELGRKADPEGGRRRTGMTDLRRLLRPFDAGGFGVRTAAAVPRLDLAGHPDLGAARRLFGRLVTAPGKLVTAALAAAPSFDLTPFAADPPSAALLLACAAASPGVKLGFDRFYGPDFVGRLADGVRLGRAHRRAALKLAAAPPTRPAPAVRLVALRPKEAAAALAAAPTPARTALTAALVAADTPGLAAADREAAARDGLALVDDRPAAKTAEAFADALDVELQTPDTADVYEVLDADGGFTRCLVLEGNRCPRRAGRVPLTVLPLDRVAGWANLPPAAVYAKVRTPKPGTLAAAVDGLSAVAPGDIKVRDTVVVVGPDGRSTFPFCVYEARGDGAFEGSWQDHPDGEWGNVRPVGRSPQTLGRLVFTGRPGATLVEVGGEVLVPAGYTAVRLAAGSEPAADRKPFRPGAPEDVGRLTRDARKVTVAAAAGGLTVHDTAWGPGAAPWAAGPKLAAAYLAAGAGLPAAAARGLVERAAGRAAPVRVIVKAADLLTDHPPVAPAWADPEPTPVTYGYTPALEETPTDQVFDVPSVNEQVAGPDDYDPFYRPDPQAVGAAQAAAESGQKEIFDTAMIAALAKSVGKRPVGSNDVGDLVRATDRLGRILFTLYYHPEAFAEKYGKGELPRLERTLQRAFEAVGEVALFLKAKTTEGRTAIDLAGVGLPDLADTHGDSAA